MTLPTQQSGHSAMRSAPLSMSTPRSRTVLAAARRARRRRGVDKTAPGGVAGRGSRPRGARPPRRCPARLANACHPSTRRARRARAARRRRDVPAPCAASSQRGSFRLVGGDGRPHCLQSMRRVVCRADAMDLQIDTSSRRADPRRDRRPRRRDAARIRQHVVRPLPRRPAADRERARARIPAFATSRSKTAAASRSAARTASSSGRRWSSSPTAAKPLASSGRATAAAIDKALASSHRWRDRRVPIARRGYAYGFGRWLRCPCPLVWHASPSRILLLHRRELGVGACRRLARLDGDLVAGLERVRFGGLLWATCARPSATLWAP